MPKTASNHTPIRMVCFDWGGIIVRICRSFREGCAAAGIEWREGADDPGLYHIRRKVSAQYQVNAITDTQFFAAVSREMNGLYTPDQIAQIHDAWLLDEYPGVDQLVTDLHAIDGLTTGMLSNTNARHWARRLSDFPVASRLHHQHASHLLGEAKPDAAIYRAFERETRFAPTETLFFDDLIENIEAAKACGWNATLIDHTADPARQMRAELARLGVLTTLNA